METTKQVDILIVIPEMGPGGAERVVSLLANTWNDNGLRVAIYTIFANKESNFYRLRDTVGWVAEPIQLKMDSSSRKGAFLFQRLLDFRKTIKTQKPKVVLGFLPTANIFCVLGAWNTGVRVVISERNCIRKRIIPIHWRLMRRLFYRYADLTIINLRTNYQILKKYINPSRIVYLRNPIARPTVEKVQSRRPIVFCVGRFNEQKRIDRIIESFAISKIEKLGWSLEIVGYGPLQQELSELVRLKGLDTHVKLMGPTENLWEVYGDASVFALVSEYEGMPNVLLEAMAHGLIPVVTKGVGDLATQISECNKSLVFDGEDFNGIANALRQLALHQSESREVASCLERLVESHYCENAIVDWTKYVLGENR